MGDEQDSWFQNAFGVNLGQSLKSIEDQASAAFDQAKNLGGQVVQGVQNVVSAAANEVSGAVSGAVKKVAGVLPSGLPTPGSPFGGGTGSFPLRGSVGRGGQNAANDVKAVQTALGIAADGKCGPQTIASIVAFQRDTLGQANPDGRIDPGGATERALAGGTKRATGAASGAGDDAALNDKIKAEFSSQIAAQTATQAGLIGELNDLENFKKTDPDPVPEFTTSFAGADPTALANDIKEKEFTIGQMDVQRTNICKQARADARLATEGAKSDLTAALLGGPGVGFGAGIAMAAASMAGGSLALLATMVTAIIAEHEIFRKYRDTIRSIVNKAHVDLTVINTAIAVERKKLDAMKKAAGQPVGNEVLIKPFKRPAEAPVDELD